MDVVAGSRDCPINSNKKHFLINSTAKKIIFLGCYILYRLQLFRKLNKNQREFNFKSYRRVST
jgi:hypothetical protein